MERQFDPPHAVEFWDDGDRHVGELIELTGDYRVARAAFEEAVKRRLLSAQPTCLRWQAPTLPAQFGGGLNPTYGKRAPHPTLNICGLGGGRCSDADTIGPVHTGATCFVDLRDHALLLMERSGTSAYPSPSAEEDYGDYPAVNGEYPETAGEYGDYPADGS